MDRGVLTYYYIWYYSIIINYREKNPEKILVLVGSKPIPPDTI